MFEAIKNNNLSAVSKLISEAHSVNAKDKEGNTPLHQCILNNCSLEMIDLLLENKPFLNPRNNELDTVLHTTIKNHSSNCHSLNILEKLIESGCDTEQTNLENLTPLALACCYRDIDLKIIQTLLEKSDYLYTCSKKQILKKRKLEVLEHYQKQNLKTEKKVKEKEKGMDNKNKIKLQKKIEKKEFLNKMIKQERKIQIKNRSNRIKKKKKEANHNYLSCYQSKYLNPDDPDVNGGLFLFSAENGSLIKDPFHLAIKNKLPIEIIILFLESGVDPNHVNRFHGSLLQNSLHIACKYAPENLKLIDLLLKYGANLESENANSRTPLFHSIILIENEEEEIINKAKEKEKEEEIINIVKETETEIEIEIEIEREVTEKKGDKFKINEKETKKEKEKKIRFKLFKYLISKKANYNLIDIIGWSCLHYLIISDYSLDQIRHCIDLGIEIRYIIKTDFKYAKRSQYNAKCNYSMDKKPIESIVTPLCLAIASKSSLKICRLLSTSEKHIYQQTEKEFKDLIGKHIAKDSYQTLFFSLNPLFYCVSNSYDRNEKENTNNSNNNNNNNNNNTNNGILKHLKFLIEELKININLKDLYGSNALHYALNNKAPIEIIKYLIENKIKINCQNELNTTPIHYACLANYDPKIIEYLIDSGADARRISQFSIYHLQFGNSDGPYRNADYITCLHYLSTNREPNIEIARILIEKGKIDINEVDSIGFNAFHVACLFGYKDVNYLKFLVAKGIDYKKTTKRGFPPFVYLFYYKTKRKKLQFIKYVLELDPYQLNYVSTESQTVLHFLYNAQCESYIYSSYLHERNPLSEEMGENYSYLRYYKKYLALSQEEQEKIEKRKQIFTFQIANYLIQKGIDPGHLSSSNKTAFVDALQNEMSTIKDFQLLIPKKKLYNSSPSKLYGFSFEEEISFKFDGLYKYQDGYYQKLSDQFQTRLGSNDNNIHTFRRNEKSKQVKKIQNFDVNDVNSPGVGKSSFHLYIQNFNISTFSGYLPSLKFKKEFYNVLQLYLDNGMDINIRDDRSNTALHFLCETHYNKCVKILIEEGADLIALNFYRFTPLHTACANCKLKPETIQLLITNENINLFSEKISLGKGQSQKNVHYSFPNSYNQQIFLNKKQNEKNTFFNIHNASEFNDDDGDDDDDDDEPNNYTTNKNNENNNDNNENINNNNNNGGDYKKKKDKIKNKNNPNKPNKGRTPLHLVASYDRQFPMIDRYRYMEILLKNGANPNLRDHQSRIPLHLIFANGFKWELKMITELLMEYNSDLNAQDIDNSTPLHFASFLIQFEIEGNSQNINYINFFNYHNNWILKKRNLTKRLQYREKQKIKHYKLIKYLVIKKNANINIKNLYDEYPLHLACRSSSHLETIKLLINKNTNVNSLSKFNLSLYFKQTNKKYGFLKRVKRGLKQESNSGKNYILKTIGKGFGYTPLQFACLTCDLPVIEYLLNNGADPNILDHLKENVLFKIIFNADYENIFNYLIQNNYLSNKSNNNNNDNDNNDNNDNDKNNNNKNNNKNNNTKINVNQLNNKGDNLLQIALKYGLNYKIIKILIDIGVNIQHINKKGQTVLHFFALNSTYSPTFIYENEYFLKKYNYDKESRKKCKKNALKIFNLLIKLYLNCGLDLNFKQKINSFGDEIFSFDDTNNSFHNSNTDNDNDSDSDNDNCDMKKNNEIIKKEYTGQTVLHILSAINQDYDIINCVISNGGEVNSKDLNLITPLHIATAFHAPVKTIKLLLDNGAELNSQDSKGNTPVFYLFNPRIFNICKYRKTTYHAFNLKKIVTLFIKSGVHFDVINNDGMPLFHLLTQYNYKDYFLYELLFDNNLKIFNYNRDNNNRSLQTFIEKNPIYFTKLLLNYCYKSLKNDQMDFLRFTSIIRQILPSNIGFFIKDIEIFEIILKIISLFKKKKIKNNLLQSYTRLILLKSNSLKIVKKFVEFRYNPEYCSIYKNNSILHLACLNIHTQNDDLQMTYKHVLNCNLLEEKKKEKRYKIIKYLLERDNSKINHFNDNNYTPLSLACKKNLGLKIIKLLVEYGAQVDLEKFLIQENEKNSSFKNVTENDNDDDNDDDDETEKGKRKQKKKKIKKINRRKMQKKKKKKKKGKRKKKGEIEQEIKKPTNTRTRGVGRGGRRARWLKKEIRQNLPIMKKKVDSLLTLISHNKTNVETLKYLFEKGAKLELENLNLHPFIISCSHQKCSLEVMKYFFKITPKEIHPLILEKSLYTVFKKIEFDSELIKFLITLNAPIKNYTNTEGGTALHLICKNHYYELIPLLIKNGLDVNAVNDKGFSSLNYIFECLTFGNLSQKLILTIKALIDHGADVNIRSKIVLETVVHKVAALTGGLEIFKYIINKSIKKTNFNIRDVFNRTPLDFITHNPNGIEMLKICIKNQNKININEGIIKRVIAKPNCKNEIKKLLLTYQSLQNDFLQLTLNGKENSSETDLVINNSVKDFHLHKWIIKMRFYNCLNNTNDDDDDKKKNKNNNKNNKKNNDDKEFFQHFINVLSLQNTSTINQIINWIYTGEIEIDLQNLNESLKKREEEIKNLKFGRMTKHQMDEQTKLTKIVFQKGDQKILKQKNRLIEIIKEIDPTINSIALFEKKSGRNGLLNDLNAFYRLKKKSNSMNFEIIVKNVPIKVHKEILFTRSKLFKDMFLNLGQMDSIVDYSGFDVQTIKILIEFLYTESIPKNLSMDTLNQLHEAVDYFQLSRNSFLYYLIDENYQN
ncbi:ankyrin repeat [Anaeramoeba flamelloides]|uniref:Ankyrin repeat n=1 Tax=Anaeramoeba flamelloides TaxID=1746091 RepID=A0ABQ8YNL8_9EUKA|nr:ankyrin repeat [Anaeramoeba flamelloides]